MLDFWATWCLPCVVQIPILNGFFADRGEEVAVLGISVDAEGREAIDPFLRDHPIDYPILLGNEALARRFGVPGYPSLAVLDPAGRIHSLHVGLIEPEELRAAVEAAEH